MADTLEQVRSYYERAVEGHIWIRETLVALLDKVGTHIAAAGSNPCVLELGSHAGFVTKKLVERWPTTQFHVWDEDQSLVEFAQRSVATDNVHYHTGPLVELPVKANIVVSVARHHHLPHDYLVSLHRVLGPGAVYVLADELCPEFCSGDDELRIANATTLQIKGGYLLTSESEVRSFDQAGLIPAQALALEARRRLALWNWYRFVVDEAVARGYFDIAAGELRSAADDMVTGSDAEHKFSPIVVERQLELAGFRRLARTAIGDPVDAQQQSMFVFEFVRLD